jgi:hypothetical protein
VLLLTLVPPSLLLLLLLVLVMVLVLLLLLQVMVVSLMVGSLFFRLGHKVSDARNFHGASFMAVLFMAMGSMPQIGVVMAQKAVWLKHRDSLLYPGYAHGVVSILLPFAIPPGRHQQQPNNKVFISD